MGSIVPQRDVLSDKAKELSAEIARLEAEIASIHKKRERDVLFRRSSYPAGPARMDSGTVQEVEPGAFRAPTERRLFDAPAKTDLAPVVAPPDPHLNELGVRKFDLAAAMQRLVDNVRGPGSANPRMVHLLAVGSIHGLRPLRYERRVARNRFLAFLVLLLGVLWGLVYLYLRQSRG